MLAMYAQTYNRLVIRHPFHSDIAFWNSEFPAYFPPILCTRFSRIFLSRDIIQCTQMQNKGFVFNCKFFVIKKKCTRV